TNATSCTASNAWSGSKATSGSEVRTNITSTSTFTLSCTGAGGTFANSAQVTVTAPTPPPPTNLVLSCPSPGTTAYASWTAPVGYNTFYFRANPGSYNWPSAVQQDTVVGTSTTFSSTPGQLYYAWVDTRDPNNGSNYS